ncbi:MAG: CpsD/CapB family tyrosine-protein kinase [Acidobacteria bacterium]|nr:CpsD/CapB family tyrosine-protein kinase [Acidobacteriota bacterium]
MSRYARVLERINAAAPQASAAGTGNQAEGSAQTSASALLPRGSAWRQEMERLRGAVVLANQLHGVQAILICGARDNDGATSVAVNLALALAEMDRTPVALADVSQSQPGVAALLMGALPGRHLKEVLPNGSSLSVQQTRIQNLYLVAANESGASLVTLLQPMDLVRRLRERFKYVILNAPPVIAHPDTGLLATKADGVMLVAQAGKSRLDQLEAAKTEFERVGANILGVVLSQCKEYLPRMLADRI